MVDSSQFLPPTKGFLGLPEKDACSPAEAKAWIVPAGLESSVSYGGGTKHGPQAILTASHQVELFDEHVWCEPYRKYGIATMKPLDLSDGLSASLVTMENTVEECLQADKFPLVLGGEHSITAGCIRPFAKRFDSVTIVQFDAHADLRDGYEGEHYSHAAAMRRCLDIENVRLVSLGIRNISAEEIRFFEANQERISLYLAKDMEQWKIDGIASAVGNDPVYITFDVDGFDSSLMSSTGTPEPGGLLWNQTMKLIEAISNQTNIVGADVVELAPQKGFHACDFLTAKLCYKILSFSLLNSGHS